MIKLHKWVQWIVAWAAGLATTGVIGLIIVFGGLFDATATTPHLPIVAWAAHTAFINSVKARAGAVRPLARVDRDQIAAGLADYDRSCAGCHGAPGVGRAAFAAGMTPSPPFLLGASRRWTPAQLYWIVHEGVKMTGMPAWGESQSDDRVWNVVAFLEAMPQISPADYARLRQSAGVKRPGAPAADVAAAHARLPAVLVLPNEGGRFPGAGVTQSRAAPTSARPGS